MQARSSVRRLAGNRVTEQRQQLDPCYPTPQENPTLCGISNSAVTASGGVHAFPMFACTILRIVGRCTFPKLAWPKLAWFSELQNFGSKIEATIEELMAEKKTLAGMRVAILATDGFEQVELEEPRKALDSAGARTVLVSPKGGTLQGMNHDEKASEFAVDMELEEARPEEFDAVLLPGGTLNADHLRVDEDAKRFVQAIDRAKKPIAVICHGPWLLVSAGLVKGRELTSYHTIQDDIRNAGGRWTDQQTVRDQNWVSSRKPDDIPAFNKAMIELFEEARGRRAQEARAG
jgi:protease I